ncbi:MAG: hypothetical protein JWP81_4704 [Ferruginibacter sp.]|nr:hypothetical protein [Ferruginibacter sp.]
MNLKPNQTAIMPSNTLPVIFSASIPYLRASKSRKLSSEKAEKVVKPPQIPVAKNNFQLPANASFFTLSAITRPIIKLPVILINKIASGKARGPTSNALAYLIMLPIAPPNPIIKKFLITYPALHVSGKSVFQINEPLTINSYHLHLVAFIFFV